MHRILSLACALLLTLAVGTTASASSFDDDTAPLVITVSDGTLVWTPTVAYGQVVVNILGTDGLVASRSFTPAEAPSLDLAALGLPDGEYTYEATITGVEGEHETVVQMGSFAWVEGTASAPDAAMVYFHIGDGSIEGSLCVGIDCISNESFGFDTFRLKENNLRIHFEDTSNSASFPTADWRIRINDSSNGGASYFAIEDSDNGTVPFRVLKGAGNNALYVDAQGDVGLNTNNPVLELHIADGDTPSMRLEQNGTSGWTPQTWDVAGNETNFFIRDVTNGSELPFRIRPDAPTNALLILGVSGNIGMGTSSPDEELHISAATETAIRLEATGTTPREWNIFGNGTEFIIRNETETVIDPSRDPDLRIDDAGDVFLGKDLTVDKDLNVDRDLFANRFVRVEDNYDATDQVFRINDRNNSSNPGDDVELFRVDGNGDVVAGGAVVHTSDVNRKEGFLPVDNAQILSAVRELPLSTWTYRGDTSRHLGPMAQDFYAAFGLGMNETTIATVDANGVALASIQALADENDALRERIARLEALVAELAAQNQ